MFELKTMYYVYIESKDGGTGCISVMALTDLDAHLMVQDMIMDTYEIVNVIKAS